MGYRKDKHIDALNFKQTAGSGEQMFISPNYDNENSNSSSTSDNNKFKS